MILRYPVREIIVILSRGPEYQYRVLRNAIYQSKCANGPAEGYSPGLRPLLFMAALT